MNPQKIQEIINIANSLRFNLDEDDEGAEEYIDEIISNAEILLHSGFGF
ncbi:hypothetical protein AB6831_04175 [Carnobacterium divergens]